MKKPPANASAALHIEIRPQEYKTMAYVTVALHRCQSKRDV